MHKTTWSLQGVEKQFDDIAVLSGISFSLHPGEAHGLVGCNGAGKTTLARILSGAIQPDRGTILKNGEPVSFSCSREAVEAGVAISTQDMNLFENMSIADNLFLSEQPTMGHAMIRQREANRKTADMLERLKINAKPSRKVGALSQGEKYLLQFARCYLASPSLLILDELAATLTAVELQTVHSMMDDLKNNGTAILYITHRMHEILAVSDRISILRDGRVAMKPETKNITERELITQVFDAPTVKHYPKLPMRFREEILRASHISNAYFHDISLALRRGEIIGLMGIAGSGRTRLLRALAGIDPITSGSLSYAGIRISDHCNRLFHNIAYIPENRDAQALFGNFNCHKNITIRNLKKISPHKVLKLRDEAISCRDAIHRLGIKALNFDGSVKFLSGGNKQKVVIARYLYSRCSVYLFDEPTQGIDTAGKVEVYNIITELARKGAGVILVSSDHQELLGMCDAVYIIRNGAIVANSSEHSWTKINIADMLVE